MLGFVFQSIVKTWQNTTQLHKLFALDIATMFLLWASLVAQMVKNLPGMQEIRTRSLGEEDSLEKGMATHSSIFAWRIPWTEEPGRLQSSRLQRVGHNWQWLTPNRVKLRWMYYFSSCFFPTRLLVFVPFCLILSPAFFLWIISEQVTRKSEKIENLPPPKRWEPLDNQAFTSRS